jgi:2-amino-4-hydroxy-6-hydroxymethyldihydropteridine diphosphokinase
VSSGRSADDGGGTAARFATAGGAAATAAKSTIAAIAGFKFEHDSEVATAYIGLGSNLGDREATLRGALARLNASHGIRVLAVSRFRETEPVGFADQPKFVNAAAAVDTELEPRPLLESLLAIERAMGRTREGTRFGPRTIDLDLLLYEDRIVDEPGLRIPHSRLHERAFVLEPLADLDPALIVPGLGPLETLTRNLE